MASVNTFLSVKAQKEDAFESNQLVASRLASEIDIFVDQSRGFVLALILAVLFQPLRKLFDHVSDKFFYQSQYKTDEFLSTLGDALTSTVNLRAMSDKAAGVMAEALRASGVSIVVHRQHGAEPGAGPEVRRVHRPGAAGRVPERVGPVEHLAAVRVTGLGRGLGPGDRQRRANPGGNEAVITDGMILSAVQARLMAIEA